MGCGGRQGDKGTRGLEDNAQCPMPNAQCPIPHTLHPTPYR
ncbi:MAG: histidine kinase [Oscillatoria sp. SIO1A7]|nr:histidine kinase [Oscillatoria sp. SIO1A7]